jgi:hypothetical protein
LNHNPFVEAAMFALNPFDGDDRTVLDCIESCRKMFTEFAKRQGERLSAKQGKLNANLQH